MIVEKCLPSDLAESIVCAMRDYSLYTSVGFAQLWRTQGGKTVCWICRRDHDVVAVMLGVEFRPRPVKRLQIMPDGLYARVLTVGTDLTERQASSIALTQALGRERYAKLFLTDFYGVFTQMNEYEPTAREAVVLDLSQPNWEVPDATLRSEIRKAEREGARIMPFDFNRHFDGFVRLMRGTESRHNRRPKYTTEFYAELAKLAVTDDRIRWTVVEHNSALACSHIYLVDGRSTLYWQAFFDKRYSFLKPNQFMLHSMARELSTTGVEELCLGGSPIDAAGLRIYKERWGGAIRTYACYTKHSILGKWL